MIYFNSKLTLSQVTSRLLLSLCLALGAIAPSAIAQTSDAASTNASGDRVFALDSRDYYGSEIYLTRSDTPSPIQLTYNSGFDSHPVWSPDGTKIAFQRGTIMGQTDIWVMNADGSNLVNLTHTLNPTESEQTPAWSPDGSRITFVSTSGSSSWQVWVMNANGSQARRLVNTNAINSTRPIWSTDGTTIQFWGNACSPTNTCSSVAELYEMNADGGELTQVNSAQY